MNKARIKTILTDIRFWLLLFFLIRLIGITNPPLEIGHNWRQSLTNMVARNFYENGPDLLHPRIDMAGEKTGILGTEFPLFNYLIYLLSYLFNYTHWYGRIINLTVTTIGLFYYYKLIRGISTKEIAFSATIILSTSVWFAFARKIMPDTFSVSLVFIGLYFAWSYLKSAKPLQLILFFLFSTLGMLCKIPALAIFSAISVVIFIKEIPTRRKILFYSVSALSVSIVAAWYFYWVPYLVKTYHYQLYFPLGFKEGIQQILPLMSQFFMRFYFSALHSYIGFICVLIGIYYLVKSKDQLLKAALTIITLVFFTFIMKTGDGFPHHNYYIIPYAPVMALLAAYFVARIPLKYQYILLGIIAIEGIANQQHSLFIPENKKYKLELEEITEAIIPKDDLIIINGGYSPQDMYFSHRKGWTIDNDKINEKGFIDSLTLLGAKFLVIDKSGFKNQLEQYDLQHDDEHYAVYKLAQQSNEKQ